ncbi:MAG: methyltransferase domain-containing protein [Dehalococcoidia bacterium]
MGTVSYEGTLYRCLECGQSLVAGQDSLRCSQCGERYPVLRGSPRLLPRTLRASLLPETDRDCVATQVADAVTRAKLRTAASFGFEWHRFPQLREAWERNFLDYMKPRNPGYFRGKRVLDAGCGNGRHAYYAATYGAEVLAVDLSDAIDVARENTHQLGCVHTVQADLYNLPFELQSFDFIYSIGVLHHLPDPEGAFRNLLRYLRPGGEIQIYLYWWPEHQAVKRALLSAVAAARRVTTRLPHGMLYCLSYPLAAVAYAGFVAPYRLLSALPAAAAFAERLPMKQYAAYPFQVCVNDQFDRFSAPIENRYTRAQVCGWLERGGLEEIRVLPNWGWLGSGRKSAPSHPSDRTPLSQHPRQYLRPTHREIPNVG